jgi:dipeptidyl aminopeptidase/acylaminoacyl peptidase
MREALEDEGKEVEWLYESAEGHGFYSTENNVNLHNEILAFLNKHLN